MNMKQITKRLADNALGFAVNGESGKAAACINLLALIKEKGYDELKGDITDNDRVE